MAIDGPDLTILSGRFSPREILESVLEPSKVISDQYAAVSFLTLSGQVITGQIVNLKAGQFNIRTNMLDPSNTTKLMRDQIDEMIPSQLSLMPQGLLNTLSQEEVLDLMAFLLSRGDREHAMFENIAENSAENIAK